MTGTLTRRAVLTAVPTAAVVVPYRDAGAADDPLLDIERAYRSATEVAQAMYEAIDHAEDREAAGDAYEAAQDIEDELERQLAETPAATLAGVAVKLRWVRQRMRDAGLGGIAIDAVDSALAYLDREAARC